MAEARKMRLFARMAAVVVVASAMACGRSPTTAVDLSTPEATPTAIPAPSPTPLEATPTAIPAPSPTPSEATSTAIPAPSPTPSEATSTAIPAPSPTPSEATSTAILMSSPTPSEATSTAILMSSPTPYSTPLQTVPPSPPDDVSIPGGTRSTIPTPAYSTPTEYTFYHVRRWYDSHDPILRMPEIVMRDVDERGKRVVIGLDCESSRDRVQQAIEDRFVELGLPLEAVVIEVWGRFRQLNMPPSFECIQPGVVDPVTGRSTPGFGGLYIDSGIAYIYLLEPSQEEAERLVFEQLGRESFERVKEVRALKGEYTWTQLMEWYQLVKKDILEIPTADPWVERRKNRLTIEVDREYNSDVETEVKEALSRHGVPHEAVILLDH